MFLGPTIIEYSNSLAFFTERIFGFLTVYTRDNSGNIHDKMVTKLLVASTTTKQNAAKKG